MFDIYVKPPDQCNRREITDFRNTLLKRSDINKENLDKRISKAKYLAFYYLESTLIGIGAIKTASRGFRNRLITGQDVRIVLDLPDSEIGWFYISEDFRGRGIGGYILSELIKQLPNSHFFSVTTSENKEIRHLLSKCGFSFSGEAKLNDKKNYYIYFRDNNFSITFDKESKGNIGENYG